MYSNLGIGAIGHKATLTESIDLAQRYGFQGIDFSITEAQALSASHGEEYVRDLFTSKGVKAGVMNFPVEFRNDQDAWREGITALPAQAKLAQTVGCTRTTTWIVPGSNERTFTEYFEFLVDRLGPAAAILADHGITLGLEFIGPKTLRKTLKYRFIYTLEGMLALGAAMGTGNVGLLLDIWHLYTSHGTLDQVRELSASEVVVVHINDAPAGVNVDEQLDQVRLLPGESGVLDNLSFLNALHEIGYNGPVTVEPFSQRVRQMVLEDAVKATSESIMRVWPDSRVKA